MVDQLNNTELFFPDGFFIHSSSHHILNLSDLEICSVIKRRVLYSTIIPVYQRG